MNLRTLKVLLGSGQLTTLIRATRAAHTCYRTAFLASGLSSGWLHRIGKGPVQPHVLAVELGVKAGHGLEAWLQLGVALRVLECGPEGYALRGNFARQLADPAHDAIAAMIEEVVSLDTLFIMRTPDRLLEGQPFTLADQDGRLVARSSRVMEHFICEAVDSVIPRRGAVRLLEIGCGSAAYIRHAVTLNPELTALGLELQSAAAKLATENVANWNLTKRITIEVGDVRERKAEPVFDVATLHQNIYYFPVEQRVAVLRHVRGFLKPGGQLLLTTFCQGRSFGAGLLNLWGAMTEGCGRLPATGELSGQLEQAGCRHVKRRRLIPGEDFYAFVASVP